MSEQTSLAHMADVVPAQSVDDAMSELAADTLCACGSLLPHDACCALDANSRLLPTPETAEILMSLYASRRGPIEDAEALCVNLLTKLPTLVAALHLLFMVHRDQGRWKAALALARRIRRLVPNDPGITCELVRLCLRERLLAEAEREARHAVRLAPSTPEPHALLANVFQERKDFAAAEFQIRRALKFSGETRHRLLHDLAQAQIQQGALEEARSTVVDILRQYPDDAPALSQMAQIEEYSRNYPEAKALLDKAGARATSLAPPMRETRARLAFEAGDLQGALVALEGPSATAVMGDTSSLLFKGRILDRLGRTDEAFAAFEAAQKIDFNEAEAYGHLAWIESTASHYRQFFVSSLMASLPRAEIACGRRQPIFIAGFARSGTTLVEQSLSMHPQIAAGGEIGSLRKTVRDTQRLLHSALPYPNALTELWMGDQRRGLDVLRDDYLNDADQQHGIAGQDAPWFTDKMIFNEMHLALISLILPQAPVIHMIRHPLDVVLSVFSHQLSGGVRSRPDLVGLARHYVAIMDLVHHYIGQAALGRYMQIRYEDLVADQRTQIGRMLDFIGEPFDEDCLRFDSNTRYARTLSFAQVRQKLNDTGVYRYRNYRRQLEPVYDILQSCIERLGYHIE